MPKRPAASAGGTFARQIRKGFFMSENSPANPDDENQPEKRRRRPRENQGAPITPEIVRKILMLHFAGKTSAQISKRTKVDQAIVERQIKEWEDKQIADSRRQMERAEKLYQLAYKAHQVSAHEALSEREKRAQLGRIKATIKKYGLTDMGRDGLIEELLKSNKEQRWLEIVSIAMEIIGRCSGNWDEDASATLEDVERILAEQRSEAVLPAEQKQRRRIIRRTESSDS